MHLVGRLYNYRNADTRLLIRALRHGWKIPIEAKAEAIEALRLVLKHGSARDKVHAVIAFAKISEINLSAEQLKNQRELIRLGRIMTGDEPGELPAGLPALPPPEASRVPPMELTEEEAAAQRQIDEEGRKARGAAGSLGGGN